MKFWDDLLAYILKDSVMRGFSLLTLITDRNYLVKVNVNNCASCQQSLSSSSSHIIFGFRKELSSVLSLCAIIPLAEVLYGCIWPYPPQQSTKNYTGLTNLQANSTINTIRN